MSKTEEKLANQWDFLLDEVVPLNINIYILDKISDFPAGVLGIRMNYKLFMRSLVTNFFGMSIIIARRVLYDTHSKSLTLRKLKNKIFETISPENRNAKKRLKTINEEVFKEYEGQINDVRNVKLAHLDQRVLNDNFKYGDITFGELKTLKEGINEYFDILGGFIGRSFDATLPTEYNETLIDNKRTDIEKILDSLALESDILTLKENHPRTWKWRVKSWKKEGKLERNLKIINDYRKRLLDLDPIEVTAST